MKYKGRFIVFFLVFLYGCSYYLYNKDVHHAVQDFFNKNFDQSIKVTDVSFNPLSPICLSNTVFVSFKSRGKEHSIPMYTIGCALTSQMAINMHEMNYISLKMNVD